MNKKILIVKTSAIGDVTHTLPALNAIRDYFPNSEITWLVEQAAADIIKGHHSVDRVLVSKRKQWVTDFKKKSFLSTFKDIRSFISQLRDTEYDLIIDFQNLLKSGIWVALARGKQKVGYGAGMDHSEYSYIFLNHRVKAVDMNIHAVTRELMLLESIGIPCEKIRFDLPITELEVETVKELLRNNGINIDNPIVAINPMAKWPTKLWTNESFAMVSDRLIDSGFIPVFTGSSEDRSEINDIISKMKYRGQALNLAGKTSLKVLAAFYKQVRFVLTTDTGPMHIAAAVETPVIALFGPTAPWRTGPFGKIHQVIRLPIPCSPCFKRECRLKTIECMRSISVDSVMLAVKQV